MNTDIDIREYRKTIDIHRKRLLFLFFCGVLGVALLVIGGYEIYEFTESNEFCGELCHDVMYPEYTVYQASPHSRVNCTECHVGEGAQYLVKSKIRGLPQMFNTALGSYPQPIESPVENLRPAREICERCHRPERFTGDIIQVRHHYMQDEQNTERVDRRVFKVGGGESGRAEDIHWHISANVWYMPMDEKRQEIGWVGVETDAGLKQFVDPNIAGELTAEEIKAEQRLMDCVDCHNRATHIFRSPEELIDLALARGAIDKTLPYIKRKGMEALGTVNPSLEAALEKVNSIRDFYAEAYPDVHSEKRAEIEAAITELEEVARLTTFPDMNVSWQTHNDNKGHLQSPGCFRCHGELVATSGPEKGTAIDATCEICHYLLPPDEDGDGS